MLKKLQVLTAGLLLVVGVITFSPSPAIPEEEQPPPTAAKPLPKVLTILGQQVDLKESQGKPGEKFIAEYIPKGETWDNWTLMFASRFVPGGKPDPKGSAEATAQRIMLRREKGDYVANAAVYEAPDHKSYVVDFLMSQGKIFEHNVFRYFAADNGLVSLQIARRVYDNDSNEQQIQEFIKSIQTKRESILNDIVRADLPVGDK